MMNKKYLLVLAVAVAAILAIASFNSFISANCEPLCPGFQSAEDCHPDKSFVESWRSYADEEVYYKEETGEWCIELLWHFACEPTPWYCPN